MTASSGVPAGRGQLKSNVSDSFPHVADMHGPSGARVPVIIAVDVDPDWRGHGRKSAAYHGDLEWDGVRVGIPQLIETLTNSPVPELRNARFTWLLRSDDQMAAEFEDPAYEAVEFAEFWKARVEAGDEIGWHPHYWRHSEAKGVWYQETDDLDWIRACLKDGHQALSRHFRLKTAKPGWTFHTNFTMTTFSELGIQFDVSALPGMRYAAVVPDTNLRIGVYDWSRAPQEPYHPRIEDYQLPGHRQALAILEVPNWTFPLGRLRGQYHARRNRAERDFANPAKRPSLMRGGFGRPPTTMPFLCYLHPEELLGRSPIFGVRHVEANLATVVQSLKRKGITPVMTVPSQLGDAAVVTE